MAEKKRLLTGMQPSGQLHIGNYLGALKPFIDLYAEYDSTLMVADYHALTALRDPKQLTDNIIDIVGTYVAAGVNPKNITIFKQSDVSEHTELAWIFECLVTVPFLMQSHAYKDKIAKGLEPNAGLFNYPMLMAADILLYDTDVVPVGEDQRQHVEYAREAAAKFNIAYGQTFSEPAERIMADIGTVPGVDGKKMSKSYGNTIPLFGSDIEIRAAVAKIITGSEPQGSALNPDTDITFALHRHFTPNLPELDKQYREGKMGYQQSKELLADNIIKTIAPMRERKKALSREAIIQILRDGAEVAKPKAEAKMKVVREKIGVTI